MYNENIDLEEEEESSGFNFKDFYENNKKLIWLLLGVIIFIILISIITSGGSSNENQEEKPKENLTPILTLDKQSASVSVGSSIQLHASVENYPGAFIMYSSADQNIATVNSTGVVTGKNVGTTRIYAVYIHSSNQVYREECIVSVSIGSDTAKLTSVSLPDGDLIMGVGTNFDLGDKLILTPSNAYIYQKHYESSNSSIVTVDEKGIVKALTVGTATITVEANNTYHYKIKVNVVSKTNNNGIYSGPDSVSITQGLIKLKLNETKRVEYTMTPSNSSVQSLTWTSSNSDVVSVNESGDIKGLKEGSATVTVTAPNGANSKTVVEVSQYGNSIVVESLSYKESTITLAVGASYSIDPTISPSNATDKSLTFTSSNSSIVSVTPTGGGTTAIITAHSLGTAIITFKSSNGVMGNVTVIVSDNTYNNGGSNSGYNGGSNSGSSGSSSGSSSSGSSSSGSSSGSSSSSGSQSTSTVKYAIITPNPTSLTLYSSSYTKFKVKANVKGTFELSTSRNEIYFGSGQSTKISANANQDIEITVRASKNSSDTISGYVMIDFTPADSSIKKTSKNVKVTVK